MDNFRETAIGLTVWYAFLAFLGGLLLIIFNHLDTHAACLAGADIALLFALGLIVKLRRLNEHSIVRGEFWRALPARERPRGEGGRRMAYSVLERVWLHSAKGAAAVAIVLCGLALANHHSGTSASAQTLPAAVSDSD
jgi:hypothetical protein